MANILHTNNVGISVTIYSPQEIKNCVTKGAQKKCFPSFALTRIAATQSRPARYEKKRKHLFSGIVSCGGKIMRLCSIFIIALCVIFFNSYSTIFINYLIFITQDTESPILCFLLLKFFSKNFSLFCRKSPPICVFNGREGKTRLFAKNP